MTPYEQNLARMVDALNGGPRLFVLTKCRKCLGNFAALDPMAPHNYRHAFEWHQLPEAVKTLTLAKLPPGTVPPAWPPNPPPPSMLPEICPRCEETETRPFHNLRAAMLQRRRAAMELALRVGAAAG
jgi:hypothetical protein